jgi:hypothetical protein
MAEIDQRSAGIPRAYRLDRGGAPTQVGMYVGEVRNNIDPTRSGRVQVWIEDFAGPEKNNPELWRTVSPVSPFYGTTNPEVDQPSGTGSYVQNRQSYGMWFTPPDIGAKLVCFFASGDSNYGYYLGSIIEPGLNHMLPAIGASRNFKLDNSAQSPYFKNSVQLPVVEINENNQELDENPRFFDQPKPVHSVVAAVMLQQGLINDTIRGPITSNAQRESPSAVYGISTPGRAIYQGGLSEDDIKRKLETGAVLPQDAAVIARRGGHSFIMDDGDLTGQDQLVRIRTAKGHQITMSDSGDCFYITHANGQSWLEFGSQGTVDIYSTNSISLRSAGDINLHADRSINMNARGSIQIRGERAIALESSFIQANAEKAMLLYSDSYVGIKSDGTLSLKSAKSGTWGAGSNMVLSAGCIALNSGDAPDVSKPSDITKQNLPDTTFEQDRGWVIKPGALKTIVTRAPTHEPFPFHNQGVTASTNLSPGETSVFPADVDNKYETIADAVFDGIGIEQYETQTPASFSIGSILPDQVTGMLAQASFNIPQSFNELSNEFGLGKYGLSPAQLESAGYLKPGTVDFYLSDSVSSISEILTSPTVWTGRGGISDVTALLTDPNLQDNIQADLYQTGLQALRNVGLATGNEQASKLAGLVQATSKYGAETVKSWVNGTLADQPLVDQLNTTVRSAQYAVELATEKVNDAIKGFSTVPVTSTNTVNRRVIDAAVETVIGNPKIPAVLFNAPAASFTPSADQRIVEAKDLLKKAEDAQVEYQRVLAANNNNTNSPAAQAAYERWQKLIIQAQEAAKRV